MPDTGYLVPDTGYLIPASVYWIPDTGYWLPDTGYWIPDTGYWIPDTGYRILNTGYQMPDTGYRISDIVYRIPDIRHRIPDTGHWILFIRCQVGSDLTLQSMASMHMEKSGLSSVSHRNFMFGQYWSFWWWYCDTWNGIVTFFYDRISFTSEVPHCSSN